MSGPGLDDLLDLDADLAEVDVEVLQHVGRHAAAFLDQAQQDVLGADVLVVEALGLLVGQLHHLPGTVGETFVHQRSTPTAVPGPGPHRSGAMTRASGWIEGRYVAVRPLVQSTRSGPAPRCVRPVLPRAGRREGAVRGPPRSGAGVLQGELSAGAPGISTSAPANRSPDGSGGGPRRSSGRRPAISPGQRPEEPSPSRASAWPISQRHLAPPSSSQALAEGPPGLARLVGPDQQGAQVHQGVGVGLVHRQDLLEPTPGVVPAALKVLLAASR